MLVGVSAVMALRIVTVADTAGTALVTLLHCYLVKLLQKAASRWVQHARTDCCATSVACFSLPQIIVDCQSMLRMCSTGEHCCLVQDLYTHPGMHASFVVVLRLSISCRSCLFSTS